MNEQNEVRATLNAHVEEHNREVILDGGAKLAGPRRDCGCCRFLWKDTPPGRFGGLAASATPDVARLGNLCRRFRLKVVSGNREAGYGPFCGNCHRMVAAFSEGILMAMFRVITDDYDLKEVAKAWLDGVTSPIKTGEGRHEEANLRRGTPPPRQTGSMPPLIVVSLESSFTHKIGGLAVAVEGYIRDYVAAGRHVVLICSGPTSKAVVYNRLAIIVVPTGDPVLCSSVYYALAARFCNNVAELLEYLDPVAKHDASLELHGWSSCHGPMGDWLYAARFVAHCNPVTRHGTRWRACDEYDTERRAIIDAREAVAVGINNTRILNECYGTCRVVPTGLYYAVDTRPVTVQPNLIRGVDTLHIRLCIVGRLDPVKNHKFAVDVLRQIHSNGQSATLTIIGEGAYMGDVRDYITHHEMSAYVNFTGVLSADEVLRTVQNHHWLLVPSFQESWCLAVVEALAVGTPVLMHTEVGVGQLNAIPREWVLPLDISRWTQAVSVKPPIRSYVIAVSMAVELETSSEGFDRCMAGLPGWHRSAWSSKRKWRRNRRSVATGPCVVWSASAPACRLVVESETVHDAYHWEHSRYNRMMALGRSIGLNLQPCIIPVIRDLIDSRILTAMSNLECNIGTLCHMMTLALIWGVFLAPLMLFTNNVLSMHSIVVLLSPSVVLWWPSGVAACCHHMTTRILPKIINNGWWLIYRSWMLLVGGIRPPSGWEQVIHTGVINDALRRYGAGPVLFIRYLLDILEAATYITVDRSGNRHIRAASIAVVLSNRYMVIAYFILPPSLVMLLTILIFRCDTGLSQTPAGLCTGKLLLDGLYVSIIGHGWFALFSIFAPAPLKRIFYDDEAISMLVAMISYRLPPNLYQRVHTCIVVAKDELTRAMRQLHLYATPDDEGIAGGTTPYRVLFSSFGTRGDRIPMDYYARCLRRAGICGDVIATHSTAQGRAVLHAVERGELGYAAATGVRACASLGGLQSRGDLLMVNSAHLFCIAPNVILFWPHPTQGEGGSVTLQNYIADMVIGWAQQSRKPGCRSGAHAHGPPHSADGARAVGSPAFRWLLRDDVTLLFSSSTGLAPGQASSNDIAGPDHAREACRATIGISHGGTGTRLTILSGGAHHSPYTAVLDRDVSRDGAVYRHYHTNEDFVMAELLAAARSEGVDTTILTQLWYSGSGIRAYIADQRRNLSNVVSNIWGYCQLVGMIRMRPDSTPAVFRVMMLCASIMNKLPDACIKVAFPYLSIRQLRRYMPALARGDFGRVFETAVSSNNDVMLSCERLFARIATRIPEDHRLLLPKVTYGCYPEKGTWLYSHGVVHGMLPWHHVGLVIDGVAFQGRLDNKTWRITGRIGGRAPRLLIYSWPLGGLDTSIVHEHTARFDRCYSKDNNCTTLLTEIFDAQPLERREGLLTTVLCLYNNWAYSGIVIAESLLAMAAWAGVNDERVNSWVAARAAFGGSNTFSLSDVEYRNFLEALDVGATLTGMPWVASDGECLIARDALCGPILDLFYIDGFNAMSDTIKGAAVHTRLLQYAPYIECVDCVEIIGHTLKCGCMNIGKNRSIDALKCLVTHPWQVRGDLTLAEAQELAGHLANDAAVGGVLAVKIKSDISIIRPLMRSPVMNHAFIVEVDSVGCNIVVTSTRSLPDLLHRRTLNTREERDSVVVRYASEPQTLSATTVTNDDRSKDNADIELGMVHGNITEWMHRARQWVNPGGPLYRVLQLLANLIDEVIFHGAMLLAQIGALWPVHKLHFGMREGVKSAWAPMPSDVRTGAYAPSAVMRDPQRLLFQMPRSLPDSVDVQAIVARQLMWHRTAMPEGVIRQSVNLHKRRMKLTPVTSNYLSARTHRWLSRYNADVGLNAATTFTTETEALSIGRYNLESVSTQEGEDLLTLARLAFTERYRSYFANTTLMSDKAFARNMVHKYGPGPMLEGVRMTTDWLCDKGNPPHLTRLIRTGTRTRAHCKAAGILAAIELQVKRDLMSGVTEQGLHGTFPKAYIDYASKLSTRPEAMRTITPMIHRDYFRNMLFNGVLNKRAAGRWNELPWALGMPMTGAGYNRKYEQVRHKRWHAEFDFSAADSHFSGALLQQIAEMRAYGYQQHPQFEAIRAWIKSNYESLERGAIFSYASGQLYPKLRGGTTGQSSVTTDGCPATQLTMIASIAGGLGLSINDVMDRYQIINMNDDGTLHTDEPLSAKQLQSISDWALRNTGQIINFGSPSDSLAGLSFCKKVFHPWSDVAEEARQYNIAAHPYAVIHDARSIIMRQTAVPYKAEPRTLYARLIGHIMLTAHNKHLYDALVSEVPDLRALVLLQAGGKGFLKSHRIPTYKAVLEAHYRPLPDWAGCASTNPWYVYLGYENAAIRALNDTRDGLRAIGIAALMGERPSLNASYPLPTRNRYIENFAYYAAGEPIDLRELSVPMRASPFGPLVAYNEFVTSGPDRTPGARSRAFAAMQYSIILTATGIWALRSTGSVPVLKWIWVCYRTYYLDGALIFGALSACVWLGTGESSLALASLIPRDPWLPIKRVVVIIVDVIPHAMLIPLIHQRSLNAVATAIEVWATALTSLQVLEEPGTRHLRVYPIDKWAEFYASRVMPRLQGDSCTLVIIAPTGSGKTTGLIPHLLKWASRSVIICVPTRSVRATAVEALGIPSLSRGVRYKPGWHYVSTSAHMSMRIAMNPSFLANISLIVIDEVHKPSAHNYVIARASKTTHLIGLTATPNSWSRKILPRAIALGAPFSANHAVTTYDWHGLELYEAVIRAKNHADIDVGRILVITARVRDVHKLLAVFEGLGMAAQRWISGDIPPNNGHVVATTVAQEGVTLAGVTCVIDMGDRIVATGGTIIRRNIDSATSKQRAGRTGRTNKGSYILLAPIIEYDEAVDPSLELMLAAPDLWPLYAASPRRLLPLGREGSVLYSYIMLNRDVFAGNMAVVTNPTLEDAAITLHVRISDPVTRSNISNALLRGVMIDELEDVLPVNYGREAGADIAYALKRLAVGGGLCVNTGGTRLAVDRPIATRGGWADGVCDVTPIDMFIKRDISISTATNLQAGGNSVALYAPVGYMTSIRATVLLAMEETGMPQHLINAVRALKPTIKSQVVDSDGVDVNDIARESHATIQLDISTKCGFIFAPTNGSLTTIRVVNTPAGYALGARTESAQYAFWDGMPTARDPTRGVVMLDNQVVAGGVPTSRLFRYAAYSCSAKQSRYVRHAYDPNVDIEYIMRNGSLMHDNSSTNCMVSSLNAITGKRWDSKAWDEALNDFLAVMHTGLGIDGALRMNTWLSHEYGTLIPSVISVLHSSAKVVLITFANMHHCCLNVITEQGDGREQLRAAAVERWARDNASRQDDRSSRTYMEKLTRGRLHASTNWSPSVACCTTRIHPLPALHHKLPDKVEFMASVVLTPGHIGVVVINNESHWNITPCSIDTFWAHRAVTAHTPRYRVLEGITHINGPLLSKSRMLAGPVARQATIFSNNWVNGKLVIVEIGETIRMTQRWARCTMPREVQGHSWGSVCNACSTAQWIADKSNGCLLIHEVVQSRPTVHTAYYPPAYCASTPLIRAPIVHSYYYGMGPGATSPEWYSCKVATGGDEQMLIRPFYNRRRVPPDKELAYEIGAVRRRLQTHSVSDNSDMSSVTWYT